MERQLYKFSKIKSLNMYLKEIYGLMILTLTYIDAHAGLGLGIFPTKLLEKYRVDAGSINLEYEKRKHQWSRRMVGYLKDARIFDNHHHDIRFEFYYDQRREQMKKMKNDNVFYMTAIYECLSQSI